MAAFDNEGKKLVFFKERSGFPVMYNEFLRMTKNPTEANKLAKEAWEALPQDKKDARTAAAKARWQETHPPPQPESEEERMRRVKKCTLVNEKKFQTIMNKIIDVEQYGTQTFPFVVSFRKKFPSKMTTSFFECLLSSIGLKKVTNLGSLFESAIKLSEPF